MAQQRPRKFKAEPYEWHEVVELKIETLSNLGAGVAKPDGWVVFVPFALPGERIRAKVWRNEANCSHADLVEILEPSPDRIEPHCRHFTTCGGCQYQHLPYEKQLEWKTRQVRELLLHMVGIEEEVNSTIPSPKQWGYRSKITPHFQRPKPGEDFPIGFLEFNRRTRLVDVNNCPIAMDEINEALQPIRDDVKRRAAEYKKGATLLLRATEDRVETDHRAPVSEKVGDLKFNFLAGDFFQNNPFILDSFTGHAAEQAKGPNQKYLLDAYCGSGLFGLTLAKNFEQVVGIELSETSATGPVVMQKQMVLRTPVSLHRRLRLFLPISPFRLNKPPFLSIPQEKVVVSIFSINFLPSVLAASFMSPVIQQPRCGILRVFWKRVIKLKASSLLIYFRRLVTSSA